MDDSIDVMKVVLGLKEAGKHQAHRAMHGFGARPEKPARLLPDHKLMILAQKIHPRGIRRHSDDCD